MGTRHLYWILTGPSFAVKAMYRKFETNIPRNETARPHRDMNVGNGNEAAQFHS